MWVVNTEISLSADTALPSRRVFLFGLDGGKDEGRQTGTGPTQGCLCKFRPATSPIWS
jgi:hypothetical protein